MRKKIISISIVAIFVLLSIPTVIGDETGNETEINNNVWKVISMKGKCDGIGYSLFRNIFGFFATRQPINLQVSDDTEIEINGESYPIDCDSTVIMRGFVGKSIWPYSWTINHKNGMEPPYDFTVFGIVKYLEIKSK